MNSRILSRLAISAVLVAAGHFVGGCASGAAEESQQVTYTATPEEARRLASTDPVDSGPLQLYMNGLSCPLCATSVDQQIDNLPGTSDVRVDLKSGVVRVWIEGKERPSPKELAEAADRAGVTLVKITR